MRIRVSNRRTQSKILYLALLPLAVILFSLPSRAASWSCADLFIEGSQVLRELARLKTEISTKQRGGDLDLARILYSQMQHKIKEARSLGIDTSSFLRETEKIQVDQGQTRTEDIDRIRKMKEREANLKPWQNSLTLTLPELNKDYDIHLSPDASRVAFVKESSSKQTIVLRKLESVLDSTEIKVDDDLYNYSINWVQEIVAVESNQPYGRSHIRIHSARTGELLQPAIFGAHQSLHPDKPLLAFMHDERELRILDLQNGQLIKHEIDHDENSNAQPSFSQDGRYLLLKSSGRVDLLNLSTGQWQKLTIGEYVQAFMRPHSTQLVVSRKTATVDILDIAQPQSARSTFGVEQKRPQLSLDGSGRLVFTRAMDSLKVFNLEDGSELQSFPKTWVSSVTASSNAKAFAFTTEKTVRVYTPAN